MGGTLARYGQDAETDILLYTLTRGEASRNAALQGISGADIAAQREQEVRHAAEILGIRTLKQGRYPDGGLRDLDPRVLERDVAKVLLDFLPHVIVTFDVQGSSVHPDHIVIHHVVKRVFVELRETQPAIQRLVFGGLPSRMIAHFPRKLFGIPDQRIHAVIDVADHVLRARQAIDAHVSVKRDVEEYNYDNWMLWPHQYFSFFQETPHPPLTDLFEGLDTSR